MLFRSLFFPTTLSCPSYATCHTVDVAHENHMSIRSLVSAVGSFKKVSVCFCPTLRINHSASCHSSSSLKGDQREPPSVLCSSSRISNSHLDHPHVAPARYSSGKFSIKWPPSLDSSLLGTCTVALMNLSLAGREQTKTNSVEGFRVA